MASNNSKVGDRVTCNGFPGTVTRTKDSEGSAWLGGMVEVRLASGTVCVSDSAPDVVPLETTARAMLGALVRVMAEADFGDQTLADECRAAIAAAKAAGL